jgi:hypothetical protein
MVLASDFAISIKNDEEPDNYDAVCVRIYTETYGLEIMLYPAMG